MISDAQRAEIRRLFYAEHWKVGTISAQLGVHHEAVREALVSEKFASRGTVRASALDVFVPFVRETLERYPRLTATRVWEMVRARGYAGSVVQLRRRVRQLELRPQSAPAYLRVRAVIGEQGQVDWAHFGRVLVGGDVRVVYGFVVVLSWSRAVHVSFHFEQNAAAVVRGHLAAFAAFGGVPRQLVYDNMKTVVLERVGDAIRFHPRLLDLAGHYHFAPRVAAPRHPQDKGRVERRIRDLRTSFLAGRTFDDRADLDRQFLQWRDDIAYRRRCPEVDGLSVADALAQECPRLLPLPSRDIDSDDVVTTVAKRQPYVRYDTNLYSIPPNLVGKPLTIAAGDDRVRVLFEGKVVAEHVRSWDRRAVIETAEHLAVLAGQGRGKKAAQGRTRLLDEVPQAEALYAELVARQERLAPETVHLLQLLDAYGAVPLGAAIAEAIARGTPRAASVAHLLAQTRRAKAPQPGLRLPERPDVHDLTTKNHRLEDYDDLSDEPT